VKKLPVAVSIAQRRTKDIVATLNNLSNSIEPYPIQKKLQENFITLSHNSIIFASNMAKRKHKQNIS
jgi:hypothetical protein